MFIDAQQGTAFHGSVVWQGGGAESDFYCTYSSSFTGTMTSAGSLTLLMDRPNRGCSYHPERFCCARVSGEDVYAGVFTDGPQITGSMTDHVSCSDPSGRRFEGERTITFRQSKIAP